MLILLLSLQSALDDYNAKKAEIEGVTEADPWVELGDWCLEHELELKAKAAYTQGEKLERGHEGAVAGMKRLSYVLDGKKWVQAKTVFSGRLKETNALDLDAVHALAMWARDYALDKEAQALLEKNLKANPYHAPTRRALGYEYAYGEWWTPDQLDAEKKIDEAFEANLDADAEGLLAAAQAAGYKGALKDVEQIVAWATSPGGQFKDEKLQNKKEQYPGEYSYGVPESYRPWRPNGLIVFTHGGGEGVGDGDDYFSQIWHLTSERGYITVCPTVLNKIALAWNNETHVGYVRAIVEEIRQKYNIDPRRTYLVGHSMGGFGCFYLGTRMTDLFAAISPWSGGPVGAQLENLKLTPTYIIHGRDDQQVKVDGSRRADERLTQLGYEHTYVEIEGFGHGVPDSEKAKAFDWLDRWRLKPAAAKP